MTVTARLWSRRIEVSRRAWLAHYLRAFWHRAYQENVTGLAGMVAYNLVLALFPFALLVLFIFGRVIQSPSVEESVVNDLQRLFPAVELTTLKNTLDHIRDSSTTIGLAAAIGAVWIGTSFWGAMDTAFCRIYHVQCRGWLEQKRFAIVMLLVVILFLAASVVISFLTVGADCSKNSDSNLMSWSLCAMNALNPASYALPKSLFMMRPATVTPFGSVFSM